MLLLMSDPFNVEPSRFITEISQELEVETRRIDQSWFNHQLLLFGGIRATIAHPSFRHAVIRNGHAAKKRKGLPCSQCKNAVYARCDHYVQVPHNASFPFSKKHVPVECPAFQNQEKNSSVGSYGTTSHPTTSNSHPLKPIQISIPTLGPSPASPRTLPFEIGRHRILSTGLWLRISSSLNQFPCNP
jgi:hypothetical protein